MRVAPLPLANLAKAGKKLAASTQLVALKWVLLGGAISPAEVPDLERKQQNVANLNTNYTAVRWIVRYPLR